MKNSLFILMMSLFLYAPAQAKKADPMEGYIAYAECAEVDPFAVGEACVVYSQPLYEDTTYGFVFDSYDWAQRWIDDELDEVEAAFFRAESCEVIKSKKKIAVLRRLNREEGIIFLNCPLDGFRLQSSKNDHSKVLKALGEKFNSNFVSGHLPRGMESQQLKMKPKFSKNLVRLLMDLEKKSLRRWKGFVDQDPDGDFSDFSKEKRKAVRNNPYEFLKVKYLNPIDEMHEIYKKESLVGYVVNLFRMVDASMIQDGSGLVLILDKDLKVVTINDWQS